MNGDVSRVFLNGRRLGPKWLQKRGVGDQRERERERKRGQRERGKINNERVLNTFASDQICL